MYVLNPTIGKLNLSLSFALLQLALYHKDMNWLFDVYHKQSKANVLSLSATYSELDCLRIWPENTGSKDTPTQQEPKEKYPAAAPT